MGDNYISCKAENGSINISEDVISTMVRTAITEIDGVAGISNTAGAELAELIGIKTVSKGIKVQIVDDTIKVDAVILVRYGCNIVNVAKEVQKLRYRSCSGHYRHRQGRGQCPCFRRCL